MEVQEIVVVVTVESLQDGKKLARALVEKKLVACVNLIPHMTSVFLWKEDVSEEQECLMLMKTQRALYSRLEQAVRDLHPYEIPEIIALPITLGLPDYLAWVRASTHSVD